MPDREHVGERAVRLWVWVSEVVRVRGNASPWAALILGYVHNPSTGDMTVILEETYTLSNGLDIPKIGLGTWFIDDAEAARVVRDAAAVGYRHIDTAQAYGNEAGVGEGVRSCGVPREQMFITTKLAAEVKSFE